MIIKKQRKNALLIGVLSFLLGACSGDTADLKAYINEMKQRLSKSIEPIPKLAPLSIYKFPENDRRRSPFKPVDTKKRNELFAPDKNRKKQALEVFPLDALKFVGTLKQGSEIWALIRQPDKQITRVQNGDYMGKNYGRVLVIKDDTIKLEETIKNSGTWEKVITTLNLDTSQ